MSKHIIIITAALLVVWTGWHLFELRKLESSEQRGKDIVVDGFVTRSNEGAAFQAAAREKRKRLISSLLFPPVMLLVYYLLDRVP